MSIQLGWAGLGHLMCVNPGSALLKAATEKQGFCGNYIAWPVISRGGGGGYLHGWAIRSTCTGLAVTAFEPEAG